MNNTLDRAAVEAQTRCWLEGLVLAENLCPFAHQPYQAGGVRICVTDAANPQTLLDDLLLELQRLQATPPEQLETTLLVHPQVLSDFYDYNDFLDAVDELLLDEGFEGEFQVASFHPDYQFADTTPEAAENYTNRSPWPMLHLLREASLEAMIARHANVEAIPQRNIQHLQTLGAALLRARLTLCQQAG